MFSHVLCIYLPSFAIIIPLVLPPYIQNKGLFKYGRLVMKAIVMAGTLIGVILCMGLGASAKAAVPTDWRAGLPEPVLSTHPEWLDLYWDTWRIADAKKQQKPTGWIFDPTFDPNYVWMWDEVFITTFGKYVQGANPSVTDPMAGIQLFYDYQRDDGFITHHYPDDGGGDVHNPILAYAELSNYLFFADTAHLKMAIPHLDKFWQWVKRNDGTGPDGIYRNSMWNNGMDNRPTSDYIIDLAGEQATVARMLIRFGQITADNQLVDKYTQEFNSLAGAINTRLWSDRDKFYTDYSEGGQQVNNWTVGAFWTIWSHVADSTKVAWLVKALQDSTNFNTPHRIPSLGKKSKDFIPGSGDYWKGATWVPTNTMTIKGLNEWGYEDLAREIAENDMKCIYLTWKRTGTIYENYSPDQPDQVGSRSKSDFAGWTGTAPIATFIEDIIGIKINAPENKVSWRLRQTGENGIRNLKWGKSWKNKLDMVAKQRTKADDPVEITLSSTADFSLTVDAGFATKTFAIQKGDNQSLTVGPTTATYRPENPMHGPSYSVKLPGISALLAHNGPDAAMRADMYSIDGRTVHGRPGALPSGVYYVKPRDRTAAAASAIPAVEYSK
jgi:hypothetical protein